jgi:hypothetical protein
MKTTNIYLFFFKLSFERVDSLLNSSGFFVDSIPSLSSAFVGERKLLFWGNRKNAIHLDDI